MIAARLFGSDRRILITLVLLVAAAILVPILNLAVPADSALHVPPYMVALILFIQRRPRGLFPQTGRAAESS